MKILSTLGLTALAVGASMVAIQASAYPYSRSYSYNNQYSGAGSTAPYYQPQYTSRPTPQPQWTQGSPERYPRYNSYNPLQGIMPAPVTYGQPSGNPPPFPTRAVIDGGAAAINCALDYAGGHGLAAKFGKKVKYVAGGIACLAGQQ